MSVLGKLMLPTALGATTGALTAGDHPLRGAMMGASLGGMGGMAGRLAGTGIGAVHGGVKGGIRGGKAGVNFANTALENLSSANIDVTKAPSRIPKIVSAPIKTVGGIGGAGAGALHGAYTGGMRGGDIGAIGGSVIGGTLGGTLADSDKSKKASKEIKMSTPFTEYMQAKTAGYSYYSPVMVPAAIGALTGGLTAGPGRHLLGAGLGAGAGLVGGHVGGLAGGTLGAMEQGSVNKKLTELAMAEKLKGLQNLSGYGAMGGQLAGAGAGGYLGGRVADIGNRQDNA